MINLVFKFLLFRWRTGKMRPGNRKGKMGGTVVTGDKKCFF